MSRKRRQLEATAEALVRSLLKRSQTPGLSLEEMQTVEHELALAKLLLQAALEKRL